MYLKRSNIPKFWPIERKGNKYLKSSDHNQNDSVPILVVLRDILKVIKTKKDLERLLHEKKILINHKFIREIGYPVSLFDIVTLPDMKKNFKAELSEKRKIVFEEVSEKDSMTKIYKIMNKNILAKGNVQLNLMHGKNIISKEKVKTGDSVLLNLKDNKIVKVIQLEKGKNAYVVKGKHAGLKGKIDEIVFRGGKELARINYQKEKVNVWVKNIIVTEA